MPLTNCRRCGHANYEHGLYGCAHVLATPQDICPCTQQVMAFHVAADNGSPLGCERCHHFHERGKPCPGWLQIDGASIVCGCDYSAMESGSQVQCSTCGHPVLIHGDEGCVMAESCSCELTPKPMLWVRNLSDGSLWVFTGEMWVSTEAAREAELPIPPPLQQQQGTWTLDLVPGVALSRDNVLACQMHEGAIRMTLKAPLVPFSSVEGRSANGMEMRFSLTMVAKVWIQVLSGDTTWGDDYRIIEFIGTYELRRAPIEVALHTFRDDQLHPELS